MARPIEGFLPVDGNQKTVELFEEAIAEAKLGKAQFGLYIICFADDNGQPSQRFSCAWSGLVCYDFPVLHALGKAQQRLLSGWRSFQQFFAKFPYDKPVYYALSVLHNHVLSGGLKRELPPSYHTLKRDASYITHNLSKGALSYDFTAWLVDNWMVMQMEGAPPPLKICFCHPDKPGQTVDDPPSRIMFEHVVRPMVRLIGGVEINEVSNRAGKDHALYRDVVVMAKQGVPVPKFSASGRHLQLMKGYQGCVTITLREADHWEHRNSNYEEWIKFAFYLKHVRGERVVFVRDTKFANDPFDVWETCPSASTELEMRMALYQHAKCNCFVSNGPWNLALFSDVPWMMFVTVEASKEFDERDTFPSSKKGWWQFYHGVKEGEQFPWSSSRQRIIWENDTYPRMRDTWLEFFDNGKLGDTNNTSPMQLGNETVTDGYGLKEGSF